MVGIDPISQEIDAVRHLSEYHEMPVCAVHAPCLLITQRVWGTEPWGKLEQSAEMARAVGADVVVVHPPFRWQRDYARGFVEGIASSRSAPASRSRSRTCTPGGPPSGEMQVYVPGLGPLRAGLRQRHHRPLALRDGAVRPGRDGQAPRRPAAAHPPDRRHRLGQGRAPGARAAARQPVAELLEHLAGVGFGGHVVRRDQHPQGRRPRGAASST